MNLSSFDQKKKNHSNNKYIKLVVRVLESNQSSIGEAPSGNLIVRI